jgi:Bardet-Biedl syndrome 4 protein
VWGLAQAPGCAQLWSNVGLCFFAKQQPDAAAACLRKALYLAPLEWTAAYNLGLVSLAGGQAAAAFLHLHQCTQLRPDFAPAFAYLGVCLAQLGDARNAKHAYDKALALAPGDPVVRLNYALSLYNAGDDGGAAAHLATFDKLTAEEAKCNAPYGSEAAPEDSDVQQQAAKLRTALAEAAADERAASAEL